MEADGAQVAGLVAVVYLVVEKVLGVVRDVMKSRGVDVSELRQELHRLNERVASAAQLGNYIEREWPRMQRSLEIHARRLSVVETEMAVVKRELGMPSGMTPPFGVPRATTRADTEPLRGRRHRTETGIPEPLDD